MDIVLALLKALVTLIPEIEQIIPIVESLINGNKITAAQAVQLWTVIANLEAMAAQKAAQVETPTS